MLTATLGGLIKDYRIKKRLSQLDLALRIGWKDTTRISKIEQGRTGRPTRDTVNKIMDALSLNGLERSQMLLASGIIPTPEEADKVLKSLKERITEFNCPVLVVDIAWNTFYFNDLYRQLIKITDEEYEFLEKNKPNWMELLFLRKSFSKVKIRGGYREKELHPFEEYQVAHFKFEQEENTNEMWFRNLLSKLKEDENFRKLWAKIPSAGAGHLYEYEFNEFTGNWRGREETLKFHVLSIHPAHDFRFYIMIHQPADEHTYKFYHDIRPK